MTTSDSTKYETTNVLPSRISDNLPAMVRNELIKFNALKQEEFAEEYTRKCKSSSTGYLCWFFGLHYAYVGKWGLLILYWITLGGFFIWWIVDLFRISGLVKDHNKDLATDIFRNLKAIS